MEKYIFTWLAGNFNESVAGTWSVWLSVIVIGLIAWLSYILFIRILNPVISLFTLKTETTWDDDLLNENVLKAFSQLAPAILIGILLPETLNADEKVYKWSVKLTEIYILWAAIHLISVFLHSLQNALDRRHLLREHNLEIVRQTIVLFVILIGIIIGISILIDRNPIVILTGLGAFAAVLMLVFRDTILGFVAGIQLTVNKMLLRGDWIVSPKAGINGEVLEVKLTTIKVRNWDNSIVTIPPYTLVSESFQNYQSMRMAGARRVSRSVFIDQTTIRFLSAEEIEQLQKEGLIINPSHSLHNSIEMAEKMHDLANDSDVADSPVKSKEETKDDASVIRLDATENTHFEGQEEQPFDGSKVVNLSLLRNYMEWYLENYPEVIHSGNGRPDLILMARQLQPTPQGLPFELYFFTSRTEWEPFEHLQSDVFNHLYAIIPKFHLAVYQAPSSSDFKNYDKSI